MSDLTDRLRKEAAVHLHIGSDGWCVHCKRSTVVRQLHRAGLRNMHAYGAKLSGLVEYGWACASADSMSWSQRARRAGVRLCDRPHAGVQVDCRNCQRWAELWAGDVARLVGHPVERHTLFDAW